MAQTTIQGSFLGDATVPGAKIGADFISAQTELTTTLATTDEIMVSDAGVIKRIDISVWSASTETFTNKTFDADGTGNSLTNVENANVKAAAAIALNKLAATTASRALVSDGSGFISAIAVTATEIGYLDGVSSAIQTQLTANSSAASAKAAVGSTTPSTQAFSDSAASGSSAEAARVDHKHAMMATPSGVPSGVIAYMAGSCPSGWTEYTAARGRYVVGVPSGGTVAGTQGTALSNQENRAVGQHTHTFSGSELGTHNHAFTGTELGTHGHTFSGSGMGGHGHTQAAHNHPFRGVNNNGNFSSIYSDSILASADSAGHGNTRRTTDNVTLRDSSISSVTPTVNSGSAGTPAGSINSITAGTPAGSNGAITAGTPAGSNANSGSVTSTNAPYIQLTVCQKD